MNDRTRIPDLPPRKPPGRSEPIVIVGAGVFGLSLAWELTKRGYEHVTVLDRYLPPVADSSSVDVSRVNPAEYADPFYAGLARSALGGWRGPDFAPFYHESGFLMLTREPGNAYVAKSVADPAGGVEIFGRGDSDSAIKARYSGVHTNLEGMTAAHNSGGGWADAAGSVRAVAQKCSGAGVSFVVGKQGTVTGLLRDASGKVTGVKVATGAVMTAACVVLATGAWTNGLVGGMDHAIRGSGQPVGFIQLTSDEAASLTPSPVIIDMDTGVFTFPPTDAHLLKVARHGFGYATEFPVLGGGTRTVSVPKTYGDNTTAAFIPEDADKALRDGLRTLAPAFADRPWAKARLCWYTDTPEGDFVVDYHPEVEGLFLATGGAGHAFKFFPVLGEHIADCFEGNASDELRMKWRLARREEGQAKTDMAGDGSRRGPALRKLSAEEQAKL